MKNRKSISIFDEIIVDNFAGGGGASTGIELALGRPIDIAINHDPDAIEMHKKNHPYTEHLCESVWDVDPVQVCRGRKIALAWFSPDCTHFSKAKGGKPVKKEIRGLAWVTLKWAKLSEELKPRVIMLENVEEFKTWGPLTDDGHPDPEHKGETFNDFVDALRSCGYEVQWRELKACDYGAPTTRKRFFLIARSDGQHIVWPEPTHASPDSEYVKTGVKKPYVPAKDIIDWSISAPSIFERKKPFCILDYCNHDVTIKNHHEDVNAFLIKYYGQGIGQEVNEPLHTIPSKDRFALITVKGIKYRICDIGLRMLTPRELYNAQGFPADYEIEIGASGKKLSKAKQVARCGNSVPPAFAAALAKVNLPEYAVKQPILTMAVLNELIAYQVY